MFLVGGLDAEAQPLDIAADQPRQQLPAAPTPRHDSRVLSRRKLSARDHEPVPSIETPDPGGHDLGLRADLGEP